jgi:hypothetical protein
MSDDNKPIFIDPKKYPSPHMIIYEPVTDYLRERGGTAGSPLPLGRGERQFVCNKCAKEQGLI